ncbi:hypothetical protein H0H93_008749 [Arthromyces matolae]|nr:hypothetical protein H0H93_008749 [Arthromyces matolae]
MPSTRSLIAWLFLSMVTAARAIPIQTTSNDGAHGAMLHPDRSGPPENLTPTVIGRSPMDEADHWSNSGVQSVGQSHSTLYPGESIKVDGGNCVHASSVSEDSGSHRNRKSTQPESDHEVVFQPAHTAKGPPPDTTYVSAGQAANSLRAAFVELQNAQTERAQTLKDQRNFGEVGNDPQKMENHDALQQKYRVLDKSVMANEEAVAAWTVVLLKKVQGEPSDMNISSLLIAIKGNALGQSPLWQRKSKTDFLAATAQSQYNWI